MGRPGGQSGGRSPLTFEKNAAGRGFRDEFETGQNGGLSVSGYKLKPLYWVTFAFGQYKKSAHLQASLAGETRTGALKRAPQNSRRGSPSWAKAASQR